MTSGFGRRKRVPSLIYVTHHVEEILPPLQKDACLERGQDTGIGKNERDSQAGRFGAALQHASAPHAEEGTLLADSQINLTALKQSP